MARVLPTPGGVVRWIIRDMRRHPELWHSYCSGSARRKFKDGGELTVIFSTAYRLWSIGYLKRAACKHDEGTQFDLKPGRFHRWRLENAVRRLTARKIAEAVL